MPLRIALIASLALALLAAPAAAHTGHGDLDADVQAAHDYWGSEVCDRQWTITPDYAAEANNRDGAATGIAFTYNPDSGVYVDERGRWDWHIERCEFTVNPRIQGCERRDIVRHEIGHFIHGPGHDGPMSPRVLRAASFCAQPRKPRRRTRAQIARSMRYQHQMARLAARL